MNKMVLYCGDDSEIAVPTKWEICSHCSGDGTTCAHVECDGGGFTSSEWAEQDDDFKRDYLAGRYDRPCPSCDGRGSVKAADYSRMSADQVKAFEAQLADDRDYDRLCRMERMMGA